jgi:hypothetical protein
MVVFVLRAAAMGDAAGDYQMLFGEEERQVAATSATTDDAAFAAKLLGAAPALKDSPQLQLLVLEKACQFGSRAPQGHETALKALDRLEKLASKRKPEWREKRMQICRAAYASASGAERDRAAGELLELLMACARQAADDAQWSKARSYYEQAGSIAAAMRSPLLADVREAVSRLLERQEAERRFEEMKTRLAREPDNVELRKMVVLHFLLSRDDPAAAAEHVTADLDEALRTYVPMAAKPVDSLPEQACLELGDWYASLAEASGGVRKVTSLSRAHGYYGRYLGLHDKQDAARLKASLAIKRIEKALAEAGGGPEATSSAAAEITFEDPEIQKAFDAGMKYLKSRQADDGSFPALRIEDAGYPVGTTAAVVCILLESGAKPEDPAVEKALAWLGEQQTNSTLGLAWRARAYHLAGRTAKKYVLPLTTDVKKLLASTAADGTFGASSTGRPDPLTGYDLRYGRYDLISTALGLMGLSAGAEAGVEVPEGLWKASMQTVLKVQHRDGGWGTTKRGYTRGARTAGGVLAVARCLQRGSGKPLTRPEAERVAPLQAGLRQLGARLTYSLSRIGDDSMYYAYQGDGDPNFYLYLWLASEAGRAAGHRKFGDTDWFRGCCEVLLKLRQGDGTWRGYDDGDAPTIFTLLFLINGSRMQSR